MLRARVVLLTILGGVLIVLALVDVGAPGDCKKADGLYHAGQLHDARSAYAAALTDSSTAACAHRGLQLVAVAQCQRAAALQGADITDKAQAAYADIATSEPVRSSAPWGVEGSDCALLTPRAVCYAAWKLTKAGLLTAARQDYIEMLQREATQWCAVAGLKKVSAAQCDAATDLARAGQADDAKKAFIAIASAEPGPPPKCALQGLASKRS